MVVPFCFDTDTGVSQACDVYSQKNLYGRKLMGISPVTFRIETNGRVRRLWPKFASKGHANEVPKAVETLQKIPA